MVIFHNRDRPNYEEVVSYGPKWWTEYREMDANYRFAGWTLDLMAYFLEQTVKNQFPSQADERTIAMFERMLRIEYDAEMTLEERRRAVAAFYSGTGHLSRSVILQLIKAYTGHDGDVYWDGDILCIVFDNNDTYRISIALLQKILDRRMPAHIAYRTMCTCHTGLRIQTRKEHWKMLFTQAGTRPMTNTGLALGDVLVEIESDTDAEHLKYPVAGASGRAGTYPDTSTGLSLFREGIEVKPNAQGYGVGFEPASENVKTGTSPVIANGYEDAEGAMLPEITTESWQVEFQLCGDDFSL